VERYEVPPERLGRWLDRWEEANAPVMRTEFGRERVTFHAADGATLQADPPFGPLPVVTLEGFAPGPLLEHVARERVVGVLLVRLGGHAAGVFAGRRLVDSKVGRRNVHGRHKAGGQSQQRFARRREGQARVAMQDAADVAARVLLPHQADLEALVLGGDRRALATVLEDPRLRGLARLGGERVLDVPDPRLDVLRATPDRFLATVLRPFPSP
jgi:Actinobacteria/chloroflexi VLRF1 release factor